MKQKLTSDHTLCRSMQFAPASVKAKFQRALTTSEASTIYSAGQNGRSFDSSGTETLAIRLSGTKVELLWQAGTLMWAASLNGPWAPVPGASAPYYQATAEGTAMFFRVQP
jgi:hypothetical protein